MALKALPLRICGAISTLSHASSRRVASITVRFNSPLLCFVQNNRTNYIPVRYEIHKTEYQSYGLIKFYTVRPLGRPRRRWEDNIKMDLQEVGGGRGDWMELAQDRDRWRAIVGTVRDFRVP